MRRRNHITEIDLQTGEEKKLHIVNGIQLYDPAFVALDLKGQRLIYTTNNAKMRGLEIYDIQQKKVVKKKKFQPTTASTVCSPTAVPSRSYVWTATWRIRK